MQFHGHPVFIVLNSSINAQLTTRAALNPKDFLAATLPRALATTMGWI